ncbi:alpha-mannosidase [Lachnospiraceae bacterium AM25-11LB]|jgi:alpha-mannosidase|uniref:alpha-mannosidase n=1 Tax=Blautia hansenii TaxID=1322 RepID=UPI000E3F2ED4|nr:alpha-mannosidase [Lachnospiraceae bacterium AM25-22]RGD07835.1 alpha-mannosidase [Lachnospiraceae bacterium AM25-11LB]RJW11371.1 alpha-mannosidase [Lachnospiraceae bacterium AM25-40]RJW15322.1 alpha-mannosidase [Lachnospiraceae bacterium AM25-39]
MRFIEDRISVICNELKELAFVKKEPVNGVVYKKGLYFYPHEADESAEPWEEFDSKTMHWYGPDEHYWFRAEYTVPKSMDGKTLYLKVATQVDHWDYAKNPQFLLFVNGQMTQGMDLNHQTVMLERCAKEGETYTIDLQGYTGVMFAELTFTMEAVEVDEKINEIYYDIVVPLQGFSRMQEDDKVRKDLRTILNNTVNLLDLRTPYSDSFYQSIEEAHNYIQKALYEDMSGYEDVIASCIGHTHIDVAWLWTVAQTREKVARSFSTVLKYMDEYPEYKFMSSQPALYQFLKERYPETYEKIKERVKEGRWEPEGGMWVEADCNLTSGESLVRQFLYGKKFFKDEFGIDSRILWLPDVFGYSGALPQIMKKSGIKYFMTTKLAWNQINKVPYDTMMWRGIDGSEIFTHLITTLGVGQSEADFFTTYNGMLHPDAILGGWHRYQNKDINNDILIAFGYGDGGGGPTREMLETSKRMEKGIRGIPKVRQEFAGNYFEELEERVEGNKSLPVWEGELYFEYHRGTYTSMGRNKRSNRRCEQLLMDAELLEVLTGTSEKEEMDKIWRTVLLNQFHDILPGSSIAEVYEVTKKEYAEIESRLAEMIAEKLNLLMDGGQDKISVFNTLGFDRNDVVSLGDCHAAALTDESGKIYPVQETAQGAVAYITDIPAKGGKTLQLLDTVKEEASRIQITENGIETPFYRISIDENGLFTSIYDKECDREVLKAGEKGNLLRMYEDKPMHYDCWDIDMYYSEKYWDAEKADKIQWIEEGPVRATLEIQRTISNSVIKQEIHFYADSRRIDFSTWVDWKEHQHLLKVHFPVNIHSDEATFEVQFGNLKRKIHGNTSWDEARFESCGQKWMDISEGHYGVSLLNDCKYGYSAKDSNIALTLIKSGIEPNKTADQEEHVFTYALYPHKEMWSAAGTVQEAYKLNQPAYATKGELKNTGKSFISTDKDNIIIETVKPAENGDGMIVRLYDCENSLTKVTLTFAEGMLESVEECNLMEEKEADIEACGNSFTVSVKPYEIKTYRVRLK